MRLFFLTALIMTAFALNSVLTRLALVSDSIGPSNFATLRAGSGALTLILLVLIIHKKVPSITYLTAVRGIALVFYLIGFSFAYLTIDTGIGALILFGGSMFVMFSGALFLSENVTKVRILGMALALLGLFILVDPRFSENSLYGIVLMLFASFGWGLYTILGHGQKAPLSNTAGNFILALIFMIPIALVIPDEVEISSYGFFLAIISGSITSGVGYALWYSVLPKIKITTASTAQLSVPLIAALGGYLFMSEILSWQFYVSSVLILGGISLPFLFKK